MPISEISGRVIALVENGMMGDRPRLLLSLRLGLLKMGTRASGPLSSGGEVPDLLSGELEGMFLAPETGDTVQTLGGGEVSQRLPEVDLRRPPGGVPMTNCTEGGDMELMSMSVFCLSGLFFMLMGADRGTLLLIFVGDGGSSFLSIWLNTLRKASRWVGTGIGSDIGKKLGRVGLATGAHGCGEDPTGSFKAGFSFSTLLSAEWSECIRMFCGTIT